MPTKHGVGTPTGLLGCQGSWNRVADSNVAACTAPQGPFPLLPATPRPRQGRAGLPAVPSLSEHAAQRGPFEPHPRTARVDSALPEPSEATLQRTDGAGRRPGFGESGRSTADPPGNRVFTVPRAAFVSLAPVPLLTQTYEPARRPRRQKIVLILQ